MKREKIALFLIILSLFFVISSRQIMAEERSIYVGDLIQIKVSTKEFSRDELKEKFKDFEVVDIKDAEDGYALTLRTFETGEKTVQLGDKEIKIEVKSTLDEIERNEIFEGDTNPEKAQTSIEWQYIFYILVIIFSITVRINIRRLFKKSEISSLSTYHRFINGINSISPSADDYLVQITRRFKEYLEAKYSFVIRGKTSNEIIDEICHISDLEGALPKVQAWLKESDYYKFAGVCATVEKNRELKVKLEELVREIEVKKEGEV